MMSLYKNKSFKLGKILPFDVTIKIIYTEFQLKENNI